MGRLVSVLQGHVPARVGILTIDIGKISHKSKTVAIINFHV